MKLHLTLSLIECFPLPAGAKRQDIWDAACPGLYIRIGKNRKTFNLTYRVGGGRRIIQWLGTYPAMSLADARTQALAIREQIAAKENI